MPTTASGTAYTVHSTALSGAGTCYWAVADSRAASAGIPTILYAHGSGGAGNQFATLAAWQGLRDWLIDNGWAWVEGDGGGGSSWGNPDSRAAYLDYLAHVETQIATGPVVLLGRSMGGLVTAWLYTHSERAGTFAGWINNSGVSTLFEGLTDGSGGALTKSTGRYFGSALWAAWGASDYDGWAAAVAADGQAAPEQYAPAVWTNKKVLCCYGDADTTVPWSSRGASVLRTLWSGLPSVDLVSVRPGGDHTSTNGSYLDVGPMTAFLAGIAPGSGSPVEPITPEIVRTIQSWTTSGGARHAIGPKPQRVFV